MTSPAASTPSGAASAHAVAFVAAHRDEAESLGRQLADATADPEAFARQLRAGFARLADPDYLAGEQRVAPGIGPVLGVRWPLNAAVARGFREATRRERPSQLLFVADRLFGEDALELRWFAFGLLERTLPTEPERTWQLLRRAAREAGDWITVDSLAHAYGRGVLLERFRWAELEQLIFSPSRWERRLVGSTIATIPFVDRRAGRAPEVAEHALPILAQLIGDAEADVQKALAWAYRSLALVALDETTAALRREADAAVATGDGHRAWVVRDALPKVRAADAAQLRALLAGIRKRPGSPSTSSAAETAARFRDLGLGRLMPEPPLA